MEYVDGVTLREKIHRERTELRKLLRYLQHVAEGLAKAHAAGIVHRDLKPDNIMITRDGHAKILDFGLAKLVEQPPMSGGDSSEVATAVMPQHSTPGTIMGTVGYISPEQAQGKTKEIDQRSDIFSFGCILYEAVTGHKAFAGADTIDSLNKIIRGPVTPIRDLTPSVPLDLQRIARRCLEKDPEDRYQTIKDVAIELRDLRREMESAAELESSATSSASSDAAVSSEAHATSQGESPSLESRAAIKTDPQPETQTADAGVGASTATSAAQLTEFKRRRLRPILALAALVVAVGLFPGLYVFFKWNRPAPFVKAKINRITSTGTASAAAISPDGRYIVHVVRNAGRQSLELRQVATNTNQEIIPPAEVSYGGLMFSQDGNYIYYLMRDKNNPLVGLYWKPVLGGEATKLLSDIGSRVSLSPDGKRLAFVRRSPGGTAVMLANADGTGEQQIASSKAPDFYNELAWSPNGKVIALTTISFQGNYHGTIVTIPVAGGAEKSATSKTWFYANSVAWLGDGSGLIISADERSFDVRQLWYISYPGGETRPITNDLNTYDWVSLTADSSSLVAVQIEQSSNIWVTPVSVGAVSSAGRAFPMDVSRVRQITTGSSKFDGFYGVSWTPDGRIAYASAASGNQDIWVMQADGSSQKQLTSDIQGSIYQTEIDPSVSPDGRYILFSSDRVNGIPHVWSMDVSGGNLKQLTNGTGEGNPQMTPDGRSVVYLDLSSKSFLWKVSVDGGEPVQLTDKPSSKPVISPDGKLIASSYQADSNTASKIVVIPIDGGAPVKLFDVTPSTDASSVAWTADGHSLVYLDTRTGVSNLWAQSLNGGRPTQLTDFRSDHIYCFAFSRDGRQLALTRGDKISNVVLFNNLK
jgi:eukaryotic-like serine/threonine-protein kinase